MKSLYATLCASVLIVSAPALAHEEKPKTLVPAPKPVPNVQPLNTNSAKHSGGTDANGCHTNHATGIYHCHNPK